MLLSSPHQASFVSTLLLFFSACSIAINTNRTISIGYILYPGFELLDVYGPLELLSSASYLHNMTLSLISFTTGPVASRPPGHLMDPSMPPVDTSHMIGPTTVATHTFENAPPLDIIMVPGGMGNVALEQENNTVMETFIARRFDHASYVLSVCTGTVTLARAGVLSGRRATTNKWAWSWVTDPAHGKNITWVPSARWVEDGKVWTSSGVAAGLDMMYAFLKHLFGAEELDSLLNQIEYAPHVDPHWDPFSVVHNVPGADRNRSLADCVVPAGH
ncbi:class I glutamine amidotransferase-like protein [Lindgomyces ingoldianus]|uniref:Class I glutamine amidotransferase-like protein n=1 Tax=Lindgomyces ingoldianus TaxID=673940 RepID=A0ACB6QMK2_9PLEO|nr:class I glutamine amidotransferase-like protein [Lindgomyces ingoldianus]KAF2467376.1 class I glutamine amidotransferase-like protein [Lindgomyces ingoldianus]